MTSILVLVIVFLGCIGMVRGQASPADLRTYAIKINVPSLEKAVEFYSGVMGFKVEKIDLKLREAYLLSGEREKIMLKETAEKLFPDNGDYSCTSFALQVNNLDNTLKTWSDKGVKFSEKEKRKEGIGFSLHYFDPFGNNFSVVEVTIGERKPFEEPKLYNFGYYIPDIQKGMDFYVAKLGFLERSERYLPDDMPLNHADNSFGFMLHLNRKEWGLRKDVNGKNAVNLVFSTKNLNQAQAYLKSIGVMTSKPMQSIGGRYVSFQDNFGIRVELIQIDSN
jgi:predicted enzyme related to lactoylglutathione lyase